MATCGCCGEFYVPQSRAWENLCGSCIAARIELMLIGGLPGSGRRPMLRASPADSSAESTPRLEPKTATG